MEGWLRICIVSTLVGTKHLYGYQYIGMTRQVDDKDHESKGCGYDGYSPYLKPGSLKMDHHTANIQTDYLTDLFISSEFTMALGGLEAGEEMEIPEITVAGARSWAHTRWPDLQTSRLASLSVKLQMVRGMFKVLGALSPAIGVFCAIFGAVQGVRTPTHQDILDATNEALTKITNEVNYKLAELSDYVDEKVHEAAKDQSNLNYKFLLSYWTGCSKDIEEDLRLECQQQAVKLGLSSFDRFLLYHDILYNVDEYAKIDQLSDSKRRGIEVNMLSFRNYAWWMVGALESLRDQYKRAYDKEKSSDPSSALSCDQLSLREKHSRDTKIPLDVSKNLQFYCMYKEELVERAIYFEKYAMAAIKEIKRVARSRFDAQLEFSENSKDHWKSTRENFNGYDVTRANCSAQIHKNKDSKCWYYVQVQGHHISNSTGNSDQTDETKIFKTIISPRLQEHGMVATGYLLDSQLIDGELIRDGARTATEWCEKRVQKRRKEYMNMEQADIERFWSKEVLKVVKCARLLATGRVDNCFDYTMIQHEPKAFETVLDLTNANDHSRDTDDANKAIDSVMSTSSSSGSTDAGTRWWSVDFVKPAFVKEVHIYGWKYTKKDECVPTSNTSPAGDSATGDSNGECCKFPFEYAGEVFTTCTKQYRAAGSYSQPWCYVGEERTKWGWCLDEEPYIKVDSGKCERGLLAKERCRAIANSNSKGFLDLHPDTNDLDTFPSGCYQKLQKDGDTKYFYNSKSDSQKECTQTRTCLCRPDTYSYLKVEMLTGSSVTTCLSPQPFPEFPSKYYEPLVVQCPHDPFSSDSKPQSGIKISLDDTNYSPRSKTKLYLAEVRVIGTMVDHGELSDDAEDASTSAVGDLWLANGRCGTAHRLSDGQPGQCDPAARENEKGPCCSMHGWCGDSAAHCDCEGCVDYRENDKWYVKDRLNKSPRIVKQQACWSECGQKFGRCDTFCGKGNFCCKDTVNKDCTEDLIDYIRSIGVSRCVKYAGPEVLVELTSTRQESTEGSSEAYLAVDSKLSTMSMTQGKRSPTEVWWSAELKKPAKIESIKAVLEGKYSKIRFEIAGTGDWRTCGEEMVSVDDSSVSNKAIQYCDPRGDVEEEESRKMKVKATPELNDGKSSLMIREIQVRVLKKNVEAEASDSNGLNSPANDG